MKNKFSICFFLTLKKIRCSFNFLKWSMRWSLIVQDGKRLVATRCFFVVPFIIQDQSHLVATKSFNTGQQRTTQWPPNHSTLNNEGKPSGHQVVQHWATKDDLVATKSFNTGQRRMTQCPPSRYFFFVWRPSGHWVVFHSPMSNNLMATKFSNERKKI